MRYSLGIDLGPETARVAASEDGRLHDVGEVPLVVGLTPGGEVVVGSGALTLEESRRASGFRDHLGQPEPLILGGTPFGVEALIAQVLRSVVDTVASDVGQWPVRIAVAHPDEWGDYHLDLLWQAAAMAEVGDVVLLTESEARAIDHDEASSAFAIARGAARWARPEDQTPPVEPAGLPISGRSAASVLAALAGGAALGVGGATATAGAAGAGAAARIADFGGGRTMADWARGGQSMSNYGDGSRMSDFGEGRSMSDFGGGGGSQPPPQPSQPSSVQTTARVGRRVPVPAIVAAVVVIVAVIAGGIALASRGSDTPDETDIGANTTAPVPTDVSTTIAEGQDRSGLVPFLFAGSTDLADRQLFEVGQRLPRDEVFFSGPLVGVEAADDGRVYMLVGAGSSELWVAEGDELELLYRDPSSGGPMSQATDLAVRGSGEDLEVFVATPQNRIVRFRPATQEIDFLGKTATIELPADGSPASDAPMAAPTSMDADGSGNLWVVEGGRGAVYRIDTSDRLTVVSGRASSGEPTDGARAADVRFQELGAIAADAEGGAAVFSLKNEIWRIRPDGTLAKLAGTGVDPDRASDQGDDGPALAAAVAVQAMAFAPDGELYIASSSLANDIRRIDGNGVIRRIAGGHPAVSARPATAHRFDPEAIDVDSNGQIYVAENVAAEAFVRLLPPEGVPPDTAAIAFDVVDQTGTSDDPRQVDGRLDNTLEFFADGAVAGVTLTEGACGRADDDAQVWDTIIGNDTAGLLVRTVVGSTGGTDPVTGDFPESQFDSPTLLAAHFQDNGGVGPGDSLCLGLLRPDGEEDETTLVIRGFDED